MLQGLRDACARRHPEASVALWLAVWLPLLALRMPAAAGRMLYITAVMASLWMHKPIPLVVTSLLPLVLMPALAVRPATVVAASYMSDANMLFLGGFLVAAAVERCGLHRRLATSILLATAGNTHLLLLGFMLATALLSAFMSNTATAAMQVPLAEGVIRRMHAARRRSGSGGAPPPWGADADGGDGGASAGAQRQHQVELAARAAAVAGVRLQPSPEPPARDFGLPGARELRVDVPLPTSPALAAVGARGWYSPLSLKPHGGASRFGRLADDAVAEGGQCSPRGAAGAASGAADAETAGFAKSLLLGIAYASSLGGISTLTGTGPNLVLIGQLGALFPAAPQLSYLLWAAFALPLVLALLLFTWALLVAGEWRRGAALARQTGAHAKRLAVDAASLRAERASLGPLSQAERSTLLVLLCTLVAWVTRHPVVCAGWDAFFAPGYVSDTTVIALATVLLFTLPGDRRAPAGKGGGAPAAGGVQPPPRLLDWETARHIPWDVVLLLGGGFALADGFTASGLSRYLACQLLSSALVTSVSLPVLLLLVCASVTAVTEVCSNVATSTIVLPILATLAQALELDPRLLMVPAAISTSLAFMLPVSTPPNAIAFATGRLEVRDMLAPGLALNAAGVLGTVAAMLLYGRAVLGITPGGPPAWSMPSGGAMASSTCAESAW